MKGRRSTRLVVLGAAVFALGAGLTFISIRGNTADASVRERALAAGDTVAAEGSAARPATRAAGVTAVVNVPRGMEAIAVELPHVPGLAGYAKPGDRVNVYAAVKALPAPNGSRQPLAKLVLTNIQVLDVRGPVAGAKADPTFVLALTTAQAERLVFLAKFESLWLTLVAPEAKPAAGVGTTYRNAL